VKARSLATLAALLLALSVFGGTVGRPASPKVIQAVSVDRNTLNVAAHESVVISATLAVPGEVSILILDRDGYPVRTLAKDQPVQRSASFGWDGRDDRGAVVPDEAYSLRIDWRNGQRLDEYFPADTPSPMTRIEARSYNRRTATLTYELPQPSRIHIQAGTATLDPKTGQSVGPVMKTVVNREPRTRGLIAEHWSGFDESGAIFIPDLKDFVVAIAATPLPENSIITFGNAKTRFVDHVAERRGASLFRHHDHAGHHFGLTTLDDVSPSLRVEPLNGTWSATDRTWLVPSGERLRVRLAVEGPSAAAFLRHPATVERFVDGHRIGGEAPMTSKVIEVPLARSSETQRVSINWNSKWGPVAANTIQVRRQTVAAASLGTSR
jgi:hypothetical protein